MLLVRCSVIAARNSSRQFSSEDSTPTMVCLAAKSRTRCIFPSYSKKAKLIRLPSRLVTCGRFGFSFERVTRKRCLVEYGLAVNTPWIVRGWIRGLESRCSSGNCRIRNPELELLNDWTKVVGS